MIKKIYPNIIIKPITDVKNFGKNFVHQHCDVLLFGLVNNYYDGYEFFTIFENNSANFTDLTNKKLYKRIENSQYISNVNKRAEEYRNIINEIADLCVIKPIFTMPLQITYIRKNFKASGIGLTIFHEYFLGNISNND